MVEILFARGLVKVLFATETFAMVSMTFLLVTAAECSYQSRLEQLLTDHSVVCAGSSRVSTCLLVQLYSLAFASTTDAASVTFYQV